MRNVDLPFSILYAHVRKYMCVRQGTKIMSVVLRLGFFVLKSLNIVSSYDMLQLSECLGFYV
jgi:hypothetical protein